MGCVSSSSEVVEIAEVLMSIDPKKVPIFSLEGEIHLARVVDVYDGDTITVLFIPDKMKDYVKFRVRLLGYDSPEMRPPKAFLGRDQIIKKANEAKAYMTKRVLDKIVHIHCGGWDKFGRLLAKIYIDNICINDEMIKEGHGIEYNGGHKQMF